MSALRLRLPRFAALVLLLWLFATGAAFAHACTDTVDLECYECCTEMTAGPGASAARADTLPAAQASVALPVVAMPTARWQAATLLAQQPRPQPSDPGGGPAIPIAFLRLAL